MKKIFTIVSLVLLFPFLIFAGTTGKLTGRVTDKKTGEPLPFVNITIEGTTLGAASDLDGRYVILNIPPGRYNVKFQYVGYQPLVVENVQISIDLTTTQDAQLEESTIELGAVIVQGNVERIQKDITSSQARVTSEQIQNLPVVELNDILQLQAGVTKDANGQFHIRGGRTTEIAYWVNGISITDPYDNSRGIEIDNSSVQELQVISGTFNAEYGQALSGIVNTVTKEGGKSFNGDVKVYSSDYVSNFTDYFVGIDRYNPFTNYNFQGSLSGPIPFTKDKLTFFATGRYVYDDGYLYGIRKFTTTGQLGDGALVPMNWSKRWIGQSNITYFASTNFKFNLEALYSKENYQDYDHLFKWEPDGNVFKYSKSYNLTFTMTHTFSNTAFYTLKLSKFFKDFNEYLYPDPFDPRYLSPDSLNTVGYAFRKTGTNLHRFFRETNSYIGKIDFTSQVTENHLIKFGVEGRIHNLKFDDYYLEPLRINGIPVVPFQPAIPDINTPNRTKYDNKPIELSAYIQDKIEYQSVIINIGLRLDYFDSRANVLVDPTDPNINLPLRPELENLSLAEREPYFYKKATPKWQIGPRFGIAYPISDKGVLHFSYGHFLQIPTFQYLFQNGPYYVPETGSGYGPYGNPDLKPQKTIMYEIGFRQEFFDDFNVDITGFYRDIRDWITAGPLITTRNLVTYSIFINKDYSNVKGITLNLNKRFSNHYSIDLNYTYQVAEGSNSRPEDEFNAQLSNNEPNLFLIPLDWDQRHLLNFSLFVGDVDWGVSLISRYGTGLPYTPSITQYTADRGITSGLQTNSRRKPNQFSMDLRLHKTFKIANLDITTFVQVFNLLDNKVVLNVFTDTGSADYTTQAQNIGFDPKRPNTVEEFLKNPTNYAAPRLVQIGFEFSF
ncbi:TonB-dependent receptor domain-containing protein [Melioribacteraceae bacterium 4301-Me]|uniref:TonB-dependent receptor n=1 Tax=Pyranulibacter aquaticus TaxID=3163344 RepID=UPI0035981715